jgi:ubiquinone/menaquinone biosynthesis C-methylase UbiE
VTPFLLQLIADPVSRKPLILKNQVSKDGQITSGILVAEDGTEYPILHGIPRFVPDDARHSVDSFGDEWNYFNFTDFKTQWLEHTVKNTFGSVDAFKGKIIVDAGGGSGSQTKWFLEHGAKHVILLDLSHSVDDVIKRNLRGYQNVDVIQCSIDRPPLLDSSICGIVYCHNVIQHTPSVEQTAKALWRTLGQGGEFVFNCYPLNDNGILRYIRFHCIYLNLRRLLSKMPFKVILAYSTLVAFLRLIPIVGDLLENLHFVAQGDVPILKNEKFFNRMQRWTSPKKVDIISERLNSAQTARG